MVVIALQKTWGIHEPGKEYLPLLLNCTSQVIPDKQPTDDFKSLQMIPGACMCLQIYPDSPKWLQITPDGSR